MKPMIDPRNLKPKKPIILNKGTTRYGQTSLG